MSKSNCVSTALILLDNEMVIDMPYQSNKSIFKKRLKNAGLSNQEYISVFESQCGKCSYCQIPLGNYDAIISCSNGIIRLICYDCDVLFRLDSSDVESFSGIVGIIRNSKK